jgi:hypothetical protein
LVLAYSIRTTTKILETRVISSPFFFDPPELQVVRALNPAAADVSAPQISENSVVRPVVAEKRPAAHCLRDAEPEES